MSFKSDNIHYKDLIGMKIKPQVDESNAREIALRIYGIKVLEICELNAYDDRNFLLFVDK